MELWPATSARRRPAPTQHVWSSTLYVAGPMPLWFMEWTLLCQGQGSSPSLLRCHYNMALRPPVCMPPFSASRVVSGSGGRVADHDMELEA